jgi:hypothetical protein
MLRLPSSKGTLPDTTERFLKIVHCRLLLFFFIVQLAHSQSRTHKIVCPDDSAREACDLFNDAVEDDDKNLHDDAAKRDHMIVCFRPNSNVFLLLSYDSPRESLWQEKDGGHFQQSGNLDFLRFINGSANFGDESVFAGDERVTRFQGASLLPGDKGRVEVDSSRIHVLHPFIKSFDDPPLVETEYELSLPLSTKEFVETSRPAKTTTRIAVTGKCVAYK